MNIAARIGRLLLLGAILSSPLRAEQGWGITNVSVPVHSALSSSVGDPAPNGACLGMLHAEIEAARMGISPERFREITTPANTRALSPAEANDPIAQTLARSSDQIFIEQAAALSQDYVLRNRDYAAEVYNRYPTEPDRVAASLRAANPSPANPQIMVMRGADNTDPARPRRYAHVLRVEGVREDADHVTYRVRDPNFPNEERILRYDKQSGTYEGYPGFQTFQHDQSTLPEENRRHLRELIEGLNAPPDQRKLPLWRDGPGGRRRRPMTVPPPGVSRSQNGDISAINDPEVGGVRLYFDPSIVEVDDNEVARWEMLRDLTRAIVSGETDVVVGAAAALELQAVSLRKALEEGDYFPRGEVTIGRLTRICGYVTRPGADDLYILGAREEGHPPIPLDILTVALREIWRNGNNPAISLDPDPADFFGPQRARLVEIDEMNRNTRFVETMLEADYRMKHILFQPDEIGGGFRSTYDLLKENPPAMTGSRQVRYWLSPYATAGADVFVNRLDGATVVYFKSDIKVQSEEMMNAMEVARSANVSGVEEEAARLFTAHYDEIAVRHPEFERLRGVFDAAKLAAILRARGVEHPLLEAVAERAVEEVPTRESYDGLGPLWVEGTAMFIGGGCEVVSRASEARDIPIVTDLAEESPGRLRVSIVLPGALPLDSGSVLALMTDAEVAAAVLEMSRGENALARERLDRLIARVSEAGDTLLLWTILPQRATAWLNLGRTDKALADVNAIGLEIPAVQSLRGLLRLFRGDSEGAYRDALAAWEAEPDDRMALEVKAQVELLTMRLDDAESSLARLIAVAPGDPVAMLMQFNLKVIRSLSPAAARERIRRYLATPLAITTALEEGQMLALAGRLDEGIARIESGLALIESRTDLPDLHLRERAWMSLISFYKMKSDQGSATEADVSRQQKYIAKLTAARPTWPSVWLVKLEYGLEPDSDGAARIALFDKASALDGANDPVLPELAINVGMDPLAYYGFRLISFVGEKMTLGLVKAAVCRRVVDMVAARFDTGPERHVLAILREQSGFYEEFERIAARMGLDFARRPATPDAIERFREEIRRELGEDVEARMSERTLRKALLRMPPPAAGAGAGTLQAIGQFYVPALTTVIDADLETLFSDESSVESKEDAAAKIRGALRDGIAMLDIEWGSLEAMRRAAGALNGLYALYATTHLAPLDHSSAIKKIEDEVRDGVLEPDAYLAAIDDVIRAAIERDREAAPGLRAFALAMGRTFALDHLRRMVQVVYEAEPAGSYDAPGDVWPRWYERRTRWDDVLREKGRDVFDIRLFVETMPLERPMDILMAQQLLSQYEKTAGNFAQNATQVGEMLRALVEKRARLELRLTRAHAAIP
jgi:tetratricopeptide (TPR) repeat protein